MLGAQSGAAPASEAAAVRAQADAARVGRRQQGVRATYRARTARLYRIHSVCLGVQMGGYTGVSDEEISSHTACGRRRKIHTSLSARYRARLPWDAALLTQIGHPATFNFRATTLPRMSRRPAPCFGRRNGRPSGCSNTDASCTLLEGSHRGTKY